MLGWMLPLTESFGSLLETRPRKTRGGTHLPADVSSPDNNTTHNTDRGAAHTSWSRIPPVAHTHIVQGRVHGGIDGAGTRLPIVAQTDKTNGKGGAPPPTDTHRWRPLVRPYKQKKGTQKEHRTSWMEGDGDGDGEGEGHKPLTRGREGTLAWRAASRRGGHHR